jgi:hypothetical protein
MVLLVIWRGLHGVLVDACECLCELVERAFPVSDAADIAAELRRAHARELERLSDRAEQLNRALQERLDGGLAQLGRALDKGLATLSEGQEEVLATLLEPEAEDADTWGMEPAPRSRAAIPARAAADDSAGSHRSPPTHHNLRWSIGRIVGEMRGTWKRLAPPPVGPTKLRDTAAPKTPHRHRPPDTPTAERGKSTQQSAAPLSRAAGDSSTPELEFLKPLISSSNVERRRPPWSRLANSLSGGLLYREPHTGEREVDPPNEPQSPARWDASKQSDDSDRPG